jgi:hypothetical protein
VEKAAMSEQPTADQLCGHPRQSRLDDLLVDAVGVAEHGGPESALDRWTKRDMAWALNQMCIRLKILRDGYRTMLRRDQEQADRSED